MTAIVGVLNKRGVGIAADSAVTHMRSDRMKVTNGANKIFTLSKYHPVAVMTYSGGAFMGVPWEIIIKEYRKHLGKTPFGKLDDYITNFLEYLRIRNFFTREDDQLLALRGMLVSFYNLCCQKLKLNNSIYKGNFLRISTNDTPPQSTLEEILKESIEENIKAGKCPEFEDYEYVDFLKYAEKILDEEVERFRIQYTDLFKEALYHHLISRGRSQIQTGLVFVGYGEDEIFPSLIPLSISLVVEGRLRYYIDEENSTRITQSGTKVAICPFAQDRVIHTIMEGIHPQYEGIMRYVIELVFSTTIQKITSIYDIKEGNEDISKAVKKLDISEVVTVATTAIEKVMQQLYSRPMMDAIESMEKNELANLAESLISLTSLIKSMQADIDSVGGPVDVAVISKGDGFIWTKRKHYFRPELNHHFIKNYFNDKEVDNGRLIGLQQ